MCVIWGIPYLMIRVAVGEISPATLVFLRTSLALVILLPFALGRGGWRDLRATDLGALIEVGLVVIGYATGPVILTRYLAAVPSLTVNSAVLALCALAYAPAAALTWPSSVPSPQVFGAVAVLAVVCTAVAFLLFFALIAEIGPVRATVITYVNPAVAATLGVLVLHESFNAGMGIGFVLVLAGSALATRRGKPPAEPEPRAAEAPSVGEVVNSGSSTTE